MRQSGFTLIELLVVIAIVGVAASQGVPSLLNFVTKTKRATAIGHLDAIRKYANLHKAETGRYPDPSFHWSDTCYSEGFLVTVPLSDCSIALAFTATGYTADGRAGSVIEQDCAVLAPAVEGEKENIYEFVSDGNVFVAWARMRDDTVLRINSKGSVCVVYDGITYNGNPDCPQSFSSPPSPTDLPTITAADY